MSQLAKTLIATAPLALEAAGGASAHPQSTWARIARKPLPDRAAAAQVTRVPEVRPANAQANSYYVTGADLHCFPSVKDPAGQTSVKFNHWNAWVDGRSYLTHPSTDDLIQWSAHKWGIPENWIRANWIKAQVASNRQMDLNSDVAQLSPKWAGMYQSWAHSTEKPNWMSETSTRAPLCVRKSRSLAAFVSRQQSLKPTRLLRQRVRHITASGGSRRQNA